MARRVADSRGDVRDMVVTTIELVQTVRVANVLGEGISWNARRQSAWWTDIEESVLYEFEPSSGSLQTFHMPHRVACFAFIEGCEELIVAFDRGIALYDVRTRAIQWIVRPGCLEEGIRFNDGKVDPAGRFWVGTMVEDRAKARGFGSLYCLDPSAGLVEHIPGIGISNGLCWSPDGSVMYHADSRTRAIRAYQFAADSGEISGGRDFATTEEGVAPDGSTVDAAGGIWNAQWGGARVSRYAPDGAMTDVVEVPVSQPTCVAFGGAALDHLLVTSARQGLSQEMLAAEPFAGDLFIFRTNFRGLPAAEHRRSCSAPGNPPTGS